MKQKLFISGPISGIPDYKVNFADAQLDIELAQNVCRSQRYCHNCMFYDRHYIDLCRIRSVFPDRLVIVNPTRLGLEGRSWLVCMIVCLWHLRKCKYIYMLLGWDKSRGATIEHNFAKFFHKTILYQQP